MNVKLKHRCSTPECKSTKGWHKWAYGALWHKQTGEMRRVCNDCADKLLATGEWTVSKPKPSDHIGRE